MKSDKKNDKSKLQNSVCSKKEVNESNGKLTLAELRKCEGFADVSDADGEEIIESLYKLSLIAFNYKVTK
ncbi:hypothetical protein ACQ9BO_08820 [Flavobacterium sp. P21]|uniref:hypothetical protein n=1 Tax=Flavobacterium sp. P21 TaxID=3423948 RepID=UPI003D672226